MAIAWHSKQVMTFLLIFNAAIVIVALVGLNADCVGPCWNGAKLNDSKYIQFISKHFMQCKYAASTLEQVWPWAVLFLALLLFTQWLLSIELLLLVHCRQMLYRVHEMKNSCLDVAIPNKKMSSMPANTNLIQVQIFMSNATSGNTLIRFISRTAYIFSCVGLALIVFFDMSSFSTYETCVSATHKKQFADLHPQTWHFVGFSLLFVGIGFQHLLAAAVYYYMVRPTENGLTYRAYYIGIDGIFVLLFTVFVILYTIVVDIQASIYIEYILVFAVSGLSLFNVIICCRMLHQKHLMDLDLGNM